MPELRKDRLVQGSLQPLWPRGMHQVSPAGRLQGLQERRHAALVGMPTDLGTGEIACAEVRRPLASNAMSMIHQ